METKEAKIKLLNLEVINLQKAISLCDKIIEIVPKFDGKAANKRLDTALKEIDKSLSFNMRYNSFIIEMYKQDRSINVGDNWQYLRDHSVSIVHSSIQSSSGDGVCQDGQHISGEQLIKDIQRNKKYMEDSLKSLTIDLGHIDYISDWYDDIQGLKAKFKDTVSYQVREYFGFDFKR
jgi:hypothetical protein